MTGLIDLSRLPAPEVVETIDYEALLSQLKALYVSLFPEDQKAEVAHTLTLESEPALKIIQAFTYREMHLRQRINDAARATMLAFAEGGNLEHIAAFFEVERLTVQPEDPVSRTPAVMEEDEELRERTQLAPQGFSVAGPRAAYISHARAVDGRILDAAVSRPQPGDILVTLLSREGDGTASKEVCDAVALALTDERVRPLNDVVATASAAIIEFQVTAKLRTFRDFDAGVVLAAARSQLEAHVRKIHRIGRAVAVSGLYAALHVEGVERVTLLAPLVDVTVGITQAPYCTAISIAWDGIHG